MVVDGEVKVRKLTRHRKTVKFTSITVKFLWQNGRLGTKLVQFDYSDTSCEVCISPRRIAQRNVSFGRGIKRDLF
jgi:hypothetical protein